MLLGNLDLLQTDFSAWLKLLALVVVGVVSAVTVHEFGHAWSALRLGDRTAQRQGRVTLNPLAHLDPGGSMFFLLVGFGWGRPTPVNPHAMRRVSPTTGMALTSFAGPLFNVLTAAVLSIPFRADFVPWISPVGPNPFITGGEPLEIAGVFLTYAILFNILLAVFNLIPLAPLDGFSVAVGVLPGEIGRAYAGLARYGIAPLLLLLFLEFLTPIGIFSTVLLPATDFIGRIVAGHPLL